MTLFCRGLGDATVVADEQEVTLTVDVDGDEATLTMDFERVHAQNTCGELIDVDLNPDYPGPEMFAALKRFFDDLEQVEVTAQIKDDRIQPTTVRIGAYEYVFRDPRS